MNPWYAAFFPRILHTPVVFIDYIFNHSVEQDIRVCVNIHEIQRSAIFHKQIRSRSLTVCKRCFAWHESGVGVRSAKVSAAAALHGGRKSSAAPLHEYMKYCESAKSAIRQCFGGLIDIFIR